MRRCWSLAALSLVLLTAGGPSAAAQTLDLGDAAGPPPLGLNSFAAECARTLEEEMIRLSGQPTADEPAGEALRATRGFRGLAVALLQRAEQRGAEGSLDFRTGFLLFVGRDDLDGVLGRAAEVESDGGEATAALRRFNEQVDARAGALASESGGELDETVGGLCRPLADAVAVLAPGQIVSHWIGAGDVAPAPGAAEPAAARIDRLLQRIEGRIDVVALTDPTKDELRRIAGYLKRGAGYAEFRPAVEQYARLLDDVLDLADAAWGAGWLDEQMRELYRTQIHEAVMLFGDPATRPEAERRLRRIAAGKRALEKISALAEGPARPGPRTRIAAVDLEALRTAFTAASAAPPEQDQGMETLVRVLDEMIAYRARPEPPLPHELRRIWRKLDESYRRAEHAVVRELPTLVARPEALADPALASHLREHEQYEEDLARLARVPAWVDTVRSLAPQAANPFAGYVRRYAAWLTDPARRPEAVRELDAIEAQLGDFCPLPYEEALRRGDRAAGLATGGLQEQLLGRIDQERRAWAASWGTDGAAAAADRMRLLYRLTTIMADTEPLLAAGEDAVVLNRWSAWELDPESYARLTADLSTRLKLATTAAIEADDAGLREQLERIHAPPTVLISRLLQECGAALAPLPGGAAGIAGQLVHRAPPDAYLGNRQRALADVCRYEMERQYAQRAGRDELAERLTAYVDMLCGELLQEVAP